MADRSQAQKYINSTDTVIGGIKLTEENKEPEIDPTVKQCWSCGILNPNHNNDNCPNSKHCLKCFSSQHKFYQCPLPRDSASMSPEEKESRYCIPCNNKGNHTSLDHRYCPTKREIIQEKIRIAREQKDQEDKFKNRDTDLIKKTLELSNLNTRPALKKKQEQQQKTSTIILLALLDESLHPGTFQNNLENHLERNGLPKVSYTLKPGTAAHIRDIYCGTNFVKPKTHVPPKPNPFSVNTGLQSNSASASTSVSASSSKQRPKARAPTPYKIKVATNSRFANDTAKYLSRQPQSLGLHPGFKLVNEKENNILTSTQK